jgi:hypothetical protein
MDLQSTARSGQKFPLWMGSLHRLTSADLAGSHSVWWNRVDFDKDGRAEWCSLLHSCAVD